MLSICALSTGGSSPEVMTAPPRPKLHPKFRLKARDALALAQDNFHTAQDSEGVGRRNSAANSLVTAGEEAVKARVFWLAYEDLVTFDPARRNERIYVSIRDLERHGPKQVLLLILDVTLAFGAAGLEFREFSQEKQRKFAGDPGPFLEQHVPGLNTLAALQDRLEDLRQSALSGMPKSGRPRPRLTPEEFANLSSAINTLIGFCDFEQNHYTREPGELLRSQRILAASMPGLIALAETLTRRQQKSPK